jgi:SAM-dependent methyltransferase
MQAAPGSHSSETRAVSDSHKQVGVYANVGANVGVGTSASASAGAGALTEHVPYNKDFTDMLEIMWGDSFLSAGGMGLIDYMLEGNDLTGRKVLDIGCGLCGPALYMARKYDGVAITAVDVDAALVAEGERRVRDAVRQWQGADSSSSSLHGSVKVMKVVPNAPLPFPDNNVDVVFGKESWLHIENKAAFCKDVARVLKPRGLLINLDWMHASPNYSADMQRFVAIDGLTFYLITSAEYQNLLQRFGFESVSIVDISQRTLVETRKDYANLKGNAATKVIQRFGDEHHNAALESWSLQAKVFASGEMQSALIKAVKS